MSKPYAVNLWGSHPDAGNDDCHTGDDFDTVEEALAVANDPWPHFEKTIPGYYSSCTAYIEIDGLTDEQLKNLGIERVRKNPIHKPSRKDDDSEWRSEMAHQAGMGLGIEAYNEAMGYD